MVEVSSQMYVGPNVPIDTLNRSLAGYKSRREVGDVRGQHVKVALSIQRHLRTRQSAQLTQHRRCRNLLRHRRELLSRFVMYWISAQHVVPSKHQHQVLKLKELKSCVVVMMRVARGYLIRVNCGMQCRNNNSAALRVQCSYRQHCARTELKSRQEAQRELIRVQKQKHSIKRLQKWWRYDVKKRRFIAAATIQLFFRHVHHKIRSRQEERDAKSEMWRFERLQVEREAISGGDFFYIRTEEEQARTVLIHMKRSEQDELMMNSSRQVKEGEIDTIKKKTQTSAVSSTTQLPSDVTMGFLSKVERKEEYTRLLIERDYLHSIHGGGVPTTADGDDDDVVAATNNRKSSNKKKKKKASGRNDDNSISLSETFKREFLPMLGNMYSESYKARQTAMYDRQSILHLRLLQDERNTRRNLLVYHYRRCDYMFTNIEYVDINRTLDKVRDDVERAEHSKRRELEDILFQTLSNSFEKQLDKGGEASVFARTLLASSNPQVRLISKDRQWSYESTLRSNNRHHHHGDVSTASASVPHQPVELQQQQRKGFQSNPFLGLVLPVVLPPQFTDDRAPALLSAANAASAHQHHHQPHQQQHHPFSRSAPLITDVAPSVTDRLNALHESRLTIVSVDKDNADDATTTNNSEDNPTEESAAFTLTRNDDDDGVAVITITLPHPLYLSPLERQALAPYSSGITISKQVPFDSYRTRVEKAVVEALVGITACAANMFDGSNDELTTSASAAARSPPNSITLSMALASTPKEEQRNNNKSSPTANNNTYNDAVRRYNSTSKPSSTWEEGGDNNEMTTTLQQQQHSLVHISEAIPVTGTTTTTPTVLNNLVVRRLGFLEEGVSGILQRLDSTRLEYHKSTINGWKPRSETPPLLELIRSITSITVAPMAQTLWRGLLGYSSVLGRELPTRALRGLLSHINFLLAKGLTTLENYTKELELSKASGSAADSAAANSDDSSSSSRSPLPPLETARIWLQQGRRRKQLLDEEEASVTTTTLSCKKKVTVVATLPPPPTKSAVNNPLSIQPSFDEQQSLFLPGVDKVTVLDERLKEHLRDYAIGGLQVVAMVDALDLCMLLQLSMRKRTGITLANNKSHSLQTEVPEVASNSGHSTTTSTDNKRRKKIGNGGSSARNTSSSSSPSNLLPPLTSTLKRM